MHGTPVCVNGLRGRDEADDDDQYAPGPVAVMKRVADAACAIGMQVLVDEAPLVEYAHAPSGRVYVESSLDARSSYVRTSRELNPWGEEEVRELPVTPYKVKVSSAVDEPVWLEVAIDGTRIHYAYLGPRAQRVVPNMIVGGVCRELLFSMPRYRAAGEAADGAGAGGVGTITARFYRTRKTGADFSGAHVHDASGFTQAHKDAAFAAAKRDGGGGAVSTTATGRVLGRAPQQAAAWRDHYTIDSVPFAERTLHYREHSTLEQLGVLPSETAATACRELQPTAGAGGDSRSAVKRERLEGVGGSRRKVSKASTQPPVVIDLCDD